MEKFYVISNNGKSGSRKLAQYVRDYLVTRGCRCKLDSGVYAEAADDHEWFRYTNPQAIPDDTQAILVIGGDGTMLQAARDLRYKGIPMMGINRGTLGYLAEVDSDNVEYALDCLMDDQYTVEERMLLYGEVKKTDGTLITSDHALNDIVLSRSSGLDVNDFNIYVDGVLLNKYVADGIIIATPTGSTAYNLSAGGPIVDPKAFSILLTPISPHSLNKRSIVLDADSQIIVEVVKRTDKRFIPVQLCYDGNGAGLMEAGDRIIIHKAAERASILKIKHISFLETVRKKMSER